MFGYFFGFAEVIENEIQPSYKDLRQRHLVMKQIRESRVKLKKTFIISPVGYDHMCQYRDIGTKKERM